MQKWLNVPITDCHVHLDSTRVIDDIVKLSRDAGFSRINIVCIAGSPERDLATNSIALLAKARYPEMIYVFGGLHYRAELPMTHGGFRQQAEELWAAGCDGIKLIESKPAHRRRTRFRMDDPVYESFFAWLQEHAVPIIWHVADPAIFWDPALVSPQAKQQGWDYTDGTFPPRENFYDEIEHVLGKFPALKAIFAHLYCRSNDHDRVDAFLTRWPSVSVDITPGAEMYRFFSKQPALWHDFFVRHQDRILFGTDNFAPREPWEKTSVGMLDKVRMMRQSLETNETFEGFGTATSKTVTGIGLPAEILPKIYSRNFEKCTSPLPRPLNVGLVKRYNQRVMDHVAGQVDQVGVLSELRTVAQGLDALEGCR